MAESKPIVRIVHNMARSGGTLVGKCLGCMKRTVLLSEIHPRGTNIFNPVRQAHEWFQLLKKEDVLWCRQNNTIAFDEAISLIERRSREEGMQLVIRDWAHLDFTGVPFVEKPSYSFVINEALRSRFAIREVAVVRHPLDQWLSLRKLAVMKNRISLPAFLRGYRKYAERCAAIDFITYENFVRSPVDQCVLMCEVLGIDFDPHFIHNWMFYKTITGDVKSSRGGNTIAHIPRRAVEPGLLEACARNRDYRKSIEILGYEHPVCDDQQICHVKPVSIEAHLGP